MPADTFNDRQPLQGMEFWVEITGQAAGTSRYAWSLTDDAAAGVFGTSSLAADFSTSGTSAVDGQPAYEVMGRTDVPVGEKVKARLSPTGEFLVFRYDVATGAGPCAGSCGSLVGALEDATFKLSLVCAEGEFAGMDTDQFAAVYAFGSGGTWTFKVWDTGTEAWVDFDLEWYTGSSGTAVVTFDADGNTVLTVGGNTLKRQCDQKDATFEGGPRNGFDGDPTLRAALEHCDPNTFVLKVECSCPPIDGWMGDSWYCVSDGEGGQVCVELLESEGDHCDGEDAYVIVSGPHASQSECEAACNPPGTIESECCTDDELIPETLYLNFSGGTGSCGCLDGVTIPLTHFAGAWSYSDSTAPHPCTAGDQQATVQCFAGEWNVSYGSPGGCAGTEVVTADLCAGNVICAGTMTVSESGPGDCCVGTIDFTVTRT